MRYVALYIVGIVFTIVLCKLLGVLSVLYTIGCTGLV